MPRTGSCVRGRRCIGTRLVGSGRALKQRRAAPGDDLLSDIVAGAARGELDEAELPGLCILLYVAGTETVADFIGNALVALAEHPDQRAAGSAARPRRRRGREAAALRSSVQYQVRTATVLTELHGQTIAAGDRVALLWGAANRDERRWDRPDELDIARSPKRNLAFRRGHPPLPRRAPRPAPGKGRARGGARGDAALPPRRPRRAHRHPQHPRCRAASRRHRLTRRDDRPMWETEASSRR
jgi:hypothetical protein